MSGQQHIRSRCSSTLLIWRTKASDFRALNSTAHLGYLSSKIGLSIFRWRMRKRWDMIPKDTDVLITHTPPINILDRNSRGRACGCPDLRQRLTDLKLRLHCFGHVHASAGTHQLNQTTYINASMVNSQYELVRMPHEVNLPLFAIHASTSSLNHPDAIFGKSAHFGNLPTRTRS
jgi:hypothetical protein